MKTVNKPFRNFFLLLALATTLGYAQEKSSKPKTDLTTARSQTNPYFLSNELAGEMALAKGNNNQNENNPFSPKSTVSNVLKTKHDTAKNSVSNIR